MEVFFHLIKSIFHNLEAHEQNSMAILQYRIFLPFNQLNIYLFQIRMSGIKKSKQSQQLFKYYIDKNIEAQKKQSMYFTRLNRYRFNSYNNKQFLKFLKLKYPIAVGVFVTIAYDYTFRMYTNPPIEH